MDGFWLFEGLEEEPYGLLPLANLSAKGGPTSTKGLERVASYQFYLGDQSASIVVPGLPRESFYFAGGRLRQDEGVVIYDLNHFKVPTGPLDPMILAAKQTAEKQKKPIDFSQYDFITDAVNLQKLFAFCQEAGDGLFRIDCERVGKTILMSRMEASDLMEVAHVTFDHSLKAKSTKGRAKVTEGPFFQLVSYQFGQFKMLVRYEVDCADYAAIGQASAPTPATDSTNGSIPEKQPFAENPDIVYMDYGEAKKQLPLQLLTTYPEGAGFPFFTWAQMFFSCADQLMIGWFKGNGDFRKPSLYALQDINKMMKPLPYVPLSKVHDCLVKISKFLTKNDPQFRIGLVWKGKPHLEIYEKKMENTGAVSPAVREYLQSQMPPDDVETAEAAAEPASS
uniref:Decapping nuclease n=1 Tax=Plectus sambesii TaxID=2011161 RepID=A0A914URQ9_9BILA